jgi:hypothetical protein
METGNKRIGVINRKIDAFVYVMDSCVTVVEIRGGPETLRTSIVYNGG